MIRNSPLLPPANPCYPFLIPVIFWETGRPVTKRDIKKMRDKKGMTLVEVLVASVIVGIIAVGMLGVFAVA